MVGDVGDMLARLLSIYFRGDGVQMCLCYLHRQLKFSGNDVLN